MHHLKRDGEHRTEKKNKYLNYNSNDCALSFHKIHIKEQNEEDEKQYE